MPYQTARKAMVDGQLRPNRVTEPRLLAAMGRLPREEFLPAGLAARAYVDEDVGLPGGRGLMEPVVIARLIQLLAVRPGDRVLVAGAGTGYGVAVLAALGARVVGVEADSALLAIARPALAAHAPPGQVTLIEAPPAGGHPEAAPYDAILVEGEIPALPDGLVAQLSEGGRLATVLGAGVALPRAVLGRRAGTGFGTVDAFDCATLCLPGFAIRPSFVF